MLYSISTVLLCAKIASSLHTLSSFYSVHLWHAYSQKSSINSQTSMKKLCRVDNKHFLAESLFLLFFSAQMRSLMLRKLFTQSVVEEATFAQNNTVNKVITVI